MTIQEFHKTKMKIINFFNRIKTKSKTKVNKNYLNIHLIIYHHMMMTTVNQIFLHHTHKNIVYNHLDQIKHPKIQMITHKTQLIHKLTKNANAKPNLYTTL